MTGQDLIQSPNGSVSVQMILPGKGAAEGPLWSAAFGGKPLLKDSRLGLEVIGLGDMLAGASLLVKATRSHQAKIRVLFGKSEFAAERYEETRYQFAGKGGRRIDLVFRCFDDAVAFRYEVPQQPGLKQVTIAEEKTSFGVMHNPLAYVQYLKDYRTSHEHNIDAVRFGEVRPDTLLDMPLTLVRDDKTYLSITEASLRRYAGMSLLRDGTSLLCKLTPREDGTKVVRQLPMETPWRVVLISRRLGGLLESNTIYCLNEANAIGSTSWIQPGKMTWPWWNGNVVMNGKAEPPIFSFEAQKTYIDFCSANGITYHSTIADNTDTPWYRQSKKGVSPGPDTDVTQVRDDLDLKAIGAYAQSKGVRLWTWVHQRALRGRVEEAFAAFERLGWSGMMVDFFDHDDQASVEHAEAILKAAAKHKILIHFHGIWKPTGWQRTYPNLMNHEGVLNLEVFKWDSRVPPEHTLKVLFTRMVAGPMDYHAGGFRAVLQKDFQVRYVAPNVMGTRCHQLASYVCFDNPTPMVADYPSAYEGQPGFDFIKLVATYWDDTKVLIGEIGRALVMARRKGKTWYIGGMSAGEERRINVPLGFLGKGPYKAEIWQDSQLTPLEPNHLAHRFQEFDASQTLQVDLGADGGFAAVLRPLIKVQQPK